MRVVIADDHRIVREGIMWMLSDETDIELVGEAEDGQELLELLDRSPVDIVVLDVRMPGMGGLEALEAMRARHPDVRVIMLSMHDEPTYVRRAVELGASGYLLKRSGRDEVMRALRSVHDGKVYVQGEVTAPLLTALTGANPDAPPHLSPRELETLKLMADGLENKQIARQLGISEATVKTYVRGVFERLAAHSRAEAVATAIRRGLID